MTAAAAAPGRRRLTADANCSAPATSFPFHFSMRSPAAIPAAAAAECGKTNRTTTPRSPWTASRAGRIPRNPGS